MFRFQFQRIYFLLFIALYCTEVIIALFFHDRFIRPYFGDFLVVILLYCMAQSFRRMPVELTLLLVLLTAYLIEIAQYFHFLKWVGLGNSPIANIVFGNGFEWLDMVAYTLGAALVWIIEKKRRQSR